MKPRPLPLILITFVLALASCNPPAPSNLPTVSMRLGDRTFQLEIADTLASREHGLMRRDSMPADHGMIFVFADEQVLPFYMKDTRIPLDIIFINASGAVVSIKQMKPYDLTTVSSDYPAKWAI